MLKDSINDKSSLPPEFVTALGNILDGAKEQEELYPAILETLKHYGHIFRREIDLLVMFFKEITSR